MTEVKVNIPSRKLADFFGGKIALKREDIDCRHKYKLTVYDISTNETLHEKPILFYDEQEYGAESSEWYKVNAGGIVDWFEYCYKSLEAEQLQCYKVRFKLSRNRFPDIDRLPEMEVRIIFPDDKMEARFCRPGSECI